MVADQCYEDSIKQRAFQGFKFGLLVAKSLELMKTKQLLNLKMRAFSGLKWYKEIIQMKDDFNQVVEHREVKDHFYAWIDLFRTNQRKKHLLQSILAKKEYYDQLEVFGVWKKDTFFKTMISLVDQIVIQPQETQLVSEIFYAWKRAHSFEKVRKQYEEIADANYEMVLTKQTF